MKKIILFVLLINTLNVDAQKLKDLLYSGKMKTDAGTKVKKDDDLSTKIDTATKKPVVMDMGDTAAFAVDSSMTVIDSSIRVMPGGEDSLSTEKVEKKTNDQMWKAFIETMTSELKTDLAANKKIKKGNYFVMVDYTIGTDGKVTINNVYPSPENKLLEVLIKDKFSLYAPQLEPAISSNGKPRKLNKRQNLNLVKD